MPLWRPSAPESLHLSRPRILAACKSSKMCPLSILHLHCEASSWASGRVGEAGLRSQRRGGGPNPRSHPLKLLVKALYKHPWSASSRPSPSPRADFGTCHLDSLAARRYFYISAGGPGVYLPHPVSLDPELGFRTEYALETLHLGAVGEPSCLLEVPPEVPRGSHGYPLVMPPWRYFATMYRELCRQVTL